MTKETGEFYAHPKASDGKDSSCKQCRKEKLYANRLTKSEYYKEYDRNRPNRAERNIRNSERTKDKYNSDPEYRDKILNTKSSWTNRNPDKKKAQTTLNNAVRDCKIIKLSSCEHCGTTEKKIQGHHWSYAAEHRLDVIWLCTSCHGKEHKRLNELGRDPDKVFE